MNFTINIDKIGDISMQNLILIGVFAIFFKRCCQCHQNQT
mgnify:CR=1 FL=1